MLSIVSCNDEVLVISKDIHHGFWFMEMLAGAKLALSLFWCHWVVGSLVFSSLIFRLLWCRVGPALISILWGCYWMKKTFAIFEIKYLHHINMILFAPWWFLKYIFIVLVLDYTTIYRFLYYADATLNFTIISSW